MHVFICSVSTDLQNCFMNACMQMHNTDRVSSRICVWGGGEERENTDTRVYI